MAKTANFLSFFKKPRQRLGWSLFVVLLVAVFAFFLDYPLAWNKTVAWLNSKLPLNLPSFTELNFRLGLDLQGGTRLIYQADLSPLAPAERGDALQGARDVIERRVNAFGVAEPDVRLVGNNRLNVELAGIKDVNEAIKLIGETPLLEFKEQGTTVTELTPEQEKEIAEYNSQAKKRAEEVLVKALQPDADFSSLAQEFSEDLSSQEQGGNLGLAGRGQFVPEFEKALFEELKDGEITKTLVQSQFGFHIIKRLSSQGEGENIQVAGAHILIKTKSPADYGVGQLEWVNTGLSGTNLKKARVDFDPNTGAPQVALEFDSEGAKLFSEITGRNVGKPVAIFLDGQPISIPTVQEQIREGQAVITGQFSLREVKLLVQRLNAGALPLPITLISQQTIGPSLGAESLAQSLKAGFYGLVAVIIFMLLIYWLNGLLAVVALIIYTILVLALFKLSTLSNLTAVTLTLSGIAGFILSIGMAVDANILIFERLKEELRAGKSLTTAIAEGFSRAWTSIRDSNVSSLITCAILIWFGSSILQGFALTLALGILVSMFSAVVLTRQFIKLVIEWRWAQKPRWYGVIKEIKQINK